jgi:hypothetical protein
MLYLATTYPGGMFAFASGMLAFAVTALSIGVLGVSLGALLMKRRKLAIAIACWSVRFGSSGVFLMLVSSLWIAVSEAINRVAGPLIFERSVADWPYLLGMLGILALEFFVSKHLQRDESR